ncbi:MAG: 4'-phosphopantetheinyl transferase superfamily protein [Beijerinckiaceae bacterium]|nr:4'-phosphopantetheinyl transferase superfamily protein [Beijerinckiaceae bacterium]
MAKALTIEWLDAAAASRVEPARPPFARVLICNLHDPALATLRSVAPNAGDLADAHYPGASGRSHFIERRVVLRAFAARCAGADPDAIRINYDEHGAPRVDGVDLFVSVSSRGGRVALAVASSPVGVDLEPVEVAGPVIEDVLGKRERQVLERLSTDARTRAFVQIWTAKEAYLKAIGRGFKRDPTLVNINVRENMFTVEDTGFPAELAAGAYMTLAEEIVACAVLPPRVAGTTF